MPRSPAQRQFERLGQQTNRPLFAKVANEPGSVSELVYVTVPTFDGGKHQHGPCRWEPRVGGGFVTMFPSAGDEALVIEDEDGDLWIVAWWPYS